METARLLGRGDPEALRRILVDHGGKVLSLLRREFHKVLDQHEIEDALSRASLRIWHAGKAYDPGRGTLGAWLLVIARNCARRVLEVKRRDSGLSLLDDLDTEPAHEVEVVEPDAQKEPTNHFAADVHGCIESLPPQPRAVLLADLAAGGSADTDMLAQQLGTTRNSIYVSRNKGRKALREALLALGHTLVEGIDSRSRRRDEAT